MKTLSRFALIIILFASFSNRLVAQDTIVMTNGNVISAKILEVSTDEVKYKRFDNLDGPVFITKTNEINMIKYKGGIMDLLNKPQTPVVEEPVDANPPINQSGPFYRQGYHRMKEREMQEIIKKVNDTQINYHVKKARFAKGMQNIGFVAIPAIAFTVGYSIVTTLNDNLNGTPPDYTPAIATGVIGVAALATSITFVSLRKSHNNAALRIYNEKY